MLVNMVRSEKRLGYALSYSIILRSFALAALLSCLCSCVYIQTSGSDLVRIDRQAANDAISGDATEEQIEGVGLMLVVNDGFVQIKEVLPDGPAARHGGLKESDYIVAVGQQAEEGLLTKMVSVAGWRLDDVVDLIRGPKGTRVVLKVWQPGSYEKTRDISLVRDVLNVPQLEGDSGL